MCKKRGFTVAELLIVVAIIGVLVSVSIPVFTDHIKKARLATNQANARAAYAAAMAWYMENYNTDEQTYKDVGTYDVATGKFIPGYEGITQPSPYENEIDINIVNWSVDSPIRNKNSKKCMGDKVFKKWDVNWNGSFDGTINSFTPYD